jgi:hypothetical protein
MAVAVMALFSSTAIASADPRPAFQTFTRGNPIAQFSNDVATWTGQIDFTAGNPKTLAWRLELKPAVQAIVFGNSMTCTSRVIELPNYLDTHAGIPANYVLHSSIPGLQNNGYYSFRSVCTFQVLTQTGLVPGKVETAVDWRVKD